MLALVIVVSPNVAAPKENHMQFRLAVLFTATAVLSSLAHAQTPLLEHRSQGLTVDAVMSADGSHTWVCGDGGVIRYRNSLVPNAPWEYQPTPLIAKDTLRRIFFLPDNVTGWAVGENGIILRTTNGGQAWTQAVHQFTPQAQSGSYDGFWDVHMLSATEGWLLGLHGIWKTTTGATGFPLPTSPVTLLDAGGSPINPSGLEFYSLDVLNCPGSDPVVIACAEPGLIFRNVDAEGTEMQVCFDILQACGQQAPLCGTGPLKPFLGEEMETALCGPSAAHFEPWDIEFQRTCNSNPLLVLVGGIGTQLGIILTSTDLGTTWKRECHECEANPALCDNSPDYGPSAADESRFWRLKKFATLYGVALFPDQTGIAGGYNPPCQRD